MHAQVSAFGLRHKKTPENRGMKFILFTVI